MMTTCLPISMNSVESLRAALKLSSQADLVAEMMTDPSLHRWMLRLDKDFVTLAHRHQEPPLCANGGGSWTTWLMLGGRGAGKTRLGAEWVRALAYGRSPYAEQRSLQIALVGETEHDVREVMIEGPAGLLHISPRSERPQWTSTRRRLEWPNGAVAFAFSAEEPEQLRGPQFDAAWCDELAKWRHADATFDMLQFGLRLAAPAHHHHAAAHSADQAPSRRSAHGGNAGAHARQCHVSFARLHRRSDRPLCRHAFGTPRDRWRDHRRTQRYFMDARIDRRSARNASAAACAHRHWCRSARLGEEGLGCLRDCSSWHQRKRCRLC